MAEQGQDRLPETDAAAVAEAERLAAQAKKRRVMLNWLRVTALLFAGLFFLGQCGMSKPRARAAIVDSCVKNVPFAERWQRDLKQHGLNDAEGALVKQYCVCMWDEPLQKLSHRQIQSFAEAGTAQQLELLGGAAAFEARDKQCLADLAKPKP